MILTVAFGKGGSCKTTTALALATYARTQGKRVLCVDIDPQANYSFALGGDSAAPGMFAVLTGKTQAAKVIQHTPQADLISAARDVADAEIFISKKRTADADFILREALAPLRSRYDLIVIDTQPDLNTLLVNALCASDSVLLPMKANSFSIMGLYQIQETITDANMRRRQRGYAPLNIAGILLTQYKPKQALASALRGSIDVGAKAEIELLTKDLCEKGMAVIFISSELEEVVRDCGRVVVLRDRRKIGELSGEQVSLPNIMKMIAE